MRTSLTSLALALWASIGITACSDDAAITADAGILDTISADAPGADAPGADAPGVDAPGADAPGADQASGDSAAIDGSGPDAPPAGPLPVFVDDYASGLSFTPFAGANNGLSLDTSTKHQGAASLKVVVPSTEFTGGAIIASTAVDLSRYNALTFWAKASTNRSLDVAGFGNDTSSTTLRNQGEAIAVTTTWKRYVIPLPIPSKVTAEKGLFHFSEGSNEGPYTLWFDEIRFETLPASVLSNPRAAIGTSSVTLDVGDSKTLGDIVTTFEVDGGDQSYITAPPYMTFKSSQPAVATVDASGVVRGVSPGTSVITAELGAVAATGFQTVIVTSNPTPTTGAPPPTVAAAKVISLFSDAYPNVSVDTWSASWDSADVGDVTLGTDNVKKYTKLAFAGVELTSTPIDVSAMTHFHVDLWTSDATVFKVKLVDFGANKTFGGGDDSEHELTYDGSSTPALTKSAWLSLDIPLASFTGLQGKKALAQLIWSASNSTVYIDNVYFYTQ